MLGRILTAIFYAAVFFALGAWTGGSLKPIGAALTRGAKAIGHGASEAWNWAFYDGQPGSNESAPQTLHGAAGSEHAPDLAAARQAFASGDVKDAVAGYKAFLAAHPADADAHGELGNIYYYNGEIGKAANAYYSAALYLLAEGRTGEATALVPAIRIGATALADDLQNRIAASAAGDTIIPSAPAETASLDGGTH